MVVVLFCFVSQGVASIIDCTFVSSQNSDVEALTSKVMCLEVEALGGD